MTCLCEKFNSNYNGTDMNGMPEYANNPVDWKGRLQHHGVLWKRSAGQSKWMRRFIVVKDGWLLYYPETEKKDFLRRTSFNIHPKAAVPLGACVITTSKEQGQQFAFILSSDEIEGNLTLAAENEYEREKWIDILTKSTRITWATQQISDDLIRQMEEQGLAMAKQKQDYFDRLQSEVSELADEKEKTWELEKLNEELEKEKRRMEDFAEEMKSEFERVKVELEDTQGYMKHLDTERSELYVQLDKQEKDLESLATEKEGVLKSLKRQETVTEQLSQEKQQTEQELQQKLQQIENQTESLLHEKSEAEMRLHENEQRAHELEEEKQLYNEQAQELQSTIKELTVQKEMTEAELKEEVMARLEAERRLNEAEKSLVKLGLAVEKETPNIEDDVKEQMVVNVNKLKEFFENLAQEAKVDPDKPVVMKNAIHARKTIMRRNKTRKFERRKSSSMRAKSMNMDALLMRGSKSLNLNQRKAMSTYIRSTPRDNDDDNDDADDTLETNNTNDKDVVGSVMQEMAFTMGEYLLCQYQMKENTLQYVGEVIAISEESLPCVEFLENTRDPVLKKRKQIPERALVDHKNIIKKLHAPETMFKGRQVMLLFEELLKSC